MHRLSTDVQTLLDAYPRIYFACHRRHVRDPQTQRRLSAHQASILDHLDTVDPTTLGDLARHMGVTPATMSIAIDRLVRTGYVTRTRSAIDRRRAELRLTEAGQRIKSASSVLEPERVEALLKQIPPDERTAALAGLARLAGAADEVIQARAAPDRGRARSSTGGGR
jgi:MarR family transcriptional regulator, organic hydroperoxide resistance regulator